MRTNGCSQAIFGGLLWGDQPVRYVFMDEAGTSAVEPVTVVVGLIANADEHVLAAEALASEAIGSVPPNHRDGFVFHATEVFGGKKYRDTWSLTDRLHVLDAMMSVPRRIGLAICVSVKWRGHDWGETASSIGLTNAQYDHVIAFGQCIAVCDRNIRRHAGPREVATVVAEDIPEMRKFLKIVPRFWRDNPTYLTREHLRETVDDAQAGYIQQSGELRVTRIRNSVHFVEKAEDPLVQVADACAYGFRRYFAGEKFGVDFVRSIVGHESRLRNFATPGGTECYWPNPAGHVNDLRLPQSGR